MTDIDILRAALREYQDAATDAHCEYLPEEARASTVFARYLALFSAAQEIERVVVAVFQGRVAIDAVRVVFGMCPLQRNVADAVRDDLLVRLCGEPGQIPECLR